MEIQGGPEFCKLDPDYPRVRSVAAELPGREFANHDLHMCIVSAQNKHQADVHLLHGTVNPLDITSTVERDHKLRKVIDEACTSEPSPSLASFRTVSTELYIPPTDCRDGSIHAGCVSSFRNEVQIERQTHFLHSNLEESSRVKTKCQERTEDNRRHEKRRKKRHNGVPGADVEAAIGMVVSAAEAMVVGQLMYSSSLSSESLGHPNFLEAALSLGQARHLCGLDKFQLNTGMTQSEELESDDLDYHSMRQAYADVGLFIDVDECEMQVQTLDMEVIKLPDEKVKVVTRALCTGLPLEGVGSLQREGESTLKGCKGLAHVCKPMELVSCFSECNSAVVAKDLDIKGANYLEATQVLQENSKAESEGQLSGSLVEEAKQSQQNYHLLAGALSSSCYQLDSTSSTRLDEEPAARSREEPGKGCKALVPVSWNSGGGIGETVAADQELSENQLCQHTEVVQEWSTAMNEALAVGIVKQQRKNCQRHPEVSSGTLSIEACSVGRGGAFKLSGERVLTCVERPTGSCKSASVSCEPKDNFGDLLTGEDPPEGDKVSTSGGSTAEDIQNIQEGVLQFSLVAEPRCVRASEPAVTYRARQSVEEANLNAEISLPSDAMVGKEDRPDASVIEKGISVPNISAKSCTPYVSRWFGGWTGNVTLKPAINVPMESYVDMQKSTNFMDIGSEDAVPEQNDFLLLQEKRVSGNEAVRLDIPPAAAEVASLTLNDNFNSKMDEASGSHVKCLLVEASALGSHLSMVDPLCSFVPCSISLASDKGQESTDLAASVEACARAVINILDRQKKVDRQPAKPLVDSDSCRKDQVGSAAEQTGADLGADISSAEAKAAVRRRKPSSMRKFSTTRNSLSLLLHAVDVAGKTLHKDHLVEGDNPQQHSTRSMLRTPTHQNKSREEDMDFGQSADGDLQTPLVVDIPNKKGKDKHKGVISADVWMCNDLSASPPLLWPQGKKRRLTACRIIDTNSVESLSGDVDLPATLPAQEHHMVEEDPIDDDHLTQDARQHSVKSSLRSSTQNILGKQCRDPKILFNGLQFLLTGFNTEKKKSLSKSIEQHGGTLLTDVPAFSPKQRFKRRGLDCGARSPPIVVAPQQVRTPKFLYGCAVGSPLLHASWIIASISAVKCLPYHQYLHKQINPVCLRTQDLSNSCEGPLFIGLQFLFYGKQDFTSQFSNLSKHAGGKVIPKLVLNGPARRKGQKMVGLLVVEGSTRVPLDLCRKAAELELHIVDAEWVVASLLCHKLRPFPTKSMSLRCLNSTQQSSSLKTSALEKCSQQKRLSKYPLHKNVREDGLGVLVKEVKTCALPEANGSNQSAMGVSLGGKEVEKCLIEIWLGKGFISCPRVPQFADRIMGPYSQSLSRRKLSKRFLYYDAFLYKGVEYFLGDNVEVQTSTADGALSVARIEGLWCEEGRLPQTRAFLQGVRKKAFKNLVLRCRRYYRPSETGFPGQGVNDLYLSNNVDEDSSASNIVRRVRVAVEVAGKVVHSNNWYEDGETALNSGEGAPNAAANVMLADYICHFFYDHVQESLHRIRFED